MESVTKKAPHIIANKIMTPDGTLLQSFHHHDYREHKDLNGKIYAVDGGLDYQRIVGDVEDLEVILITTDDDFEVIRSEFRWGTYGKNGKSLRTFKTLNMLSNSHIQAIIDTQKRLDIWVIQLFQAELSYRSLNNINIQDTDMVIDKLNEYYNNEHLEEGEVLDRLLECPDMNPTLKQLIIDTDGDQLTDAEAIMIIAIYYRNA